MTFAEKEPARRHSVPFIQGMQSPDDFAQQK
jgi:hypothetical protein